MRKVDGIKQVTKNRFLNYYELDMLNEDGSHGAYYLASRAEQCEDLKIRTRVNKADGVVIFAVYKDSENQDDERIVLIRQYRCPIDDYIYEFPAGLVDEGEDFKAAGVRELKEETGLDFEPLPADDMFTKPFFTTIGMTDESCGTVYGYASGIPSRDGQEVTEDIEIILADRQEAARILQEETTAIICAYQLMHFISTPPGHVFDFLNIEGDENVSAKL